MITVSGVNNAACETAGSTGITTASITPTRPAGQGLGNGNHRTFSFSAHCGNSFGANGSFTNFANNNQIIGSGTTLSGAGARRLQVGYRDAMTTVPAFTVPSASNQCQALGLVNLVKEPDESWGVPVVLDADLAFGTYTRIFDYVGSFGNPISYRMFIMIASVVNDLATVTSATLTGTGYTFNNTTKRVDGGTNVGFDVSLSVYTAEVAATSTADYVFDPAYSATTQNGAVVVAQTISSIRGTLPAIHDGSALVTPSSSAVTKAKIWDGAAWVDARAKRYRAEDANSAAGWK